MCFICNKNMFTLNEKKTLKIGYHENVLSVCIIATLDFIFTSKHTKG